MPDSPNQHHEKPGLTGDALRITLVYLLVGGLWIILSDQAVKLLVPDMGTFALVSTYKGWFFVLGTAVLIYALVGRALARARAAERGLQENLTHYRELAESVSDVFMALDHDLCFVYWNQAAEEQLGVPAQVALGKPVCMLFPHLCQGGLEDFLRRTLAQKTPGTLRLETPGVEGTRHLELRAYPARRGLSVVVRDFTSQQIAEDERQRLSAALEQTAEGVTIWDGDFRLVYANPSYLAMEGRELDGLMGQSLPMLAGAQGQAIRQAVQAEGRTWSGRLEGPRPGGGLRHSEATVTPVRDAAGRIVNYVHLERDVTQEVELERQMRRVQRMEAMGTLAGGVAHDFNNILASIVGYTELAQGELPARSPARQNLDQVLAASQRARDLVGQILAFSRHAEVRPRALDLEHEVPEALRLLRASLPSTVEISWQTDPQPCTVMADVTEVHQVLMNLCANAAHAMRAQGGKLTVGVRRRELTAPDPQWGLGPGPYVSLRVDDTGSGMEPEVLRRIFEAFYTTKQDGEGTGLGLAVVQGIVRSWRGAIRVWSRPGQGSSFEIMVPRVPPSVAQAVSEHLDNPGGHERLLVVDDEKVLADMESQVLARLGYRVESTSSALRALALVTHSPMAFDLVLTDQTMPMLTGLELARRLHQVRPGLPVIITTGFSEQLTSEGLATAGVHSVLQKPVSAADLACQVRKALDTTAVFPTSPPLKPEAPTDLTAQLP